MRSLSPSLQSPSFPRATSKTKVKVTLLSAAILICCWALGARPAEAQAAPGGLALNANGPVLAVVQPSEKILIAGGFITLMPNGGSAVTGNRIVGLESDGRFTLTASPSTVNPGLGQSITVNWTAPEGRPANDWIGLYKVGDPDTSYSAWHYTPGSSSGVIFFPAPNQTGQYEFRYFTDNSYNRVATSNPVTVAEVNDLPFSLSAVPSAVDPGAVITVTWTAPNGRPANDWLGLYKVGDPDTGYSAWHYTGGTPSGGTTFIAPSQAGQYEFRYFTNNSYTKVATSNPVTVGGGGEGNYPDTSLPLSADTTIKPDAALSNTTSINASTSTNFKGKLEGSPATGVVRITDAHPAGTYTVTVTAFDSGGATTTKTFHLTVTTPATCIPVNFAAAVGIDSGVNPVSVAIGDFNGDGKQDLAVANDFSNDVSILLGDGAGRFSDATNFGVGATPFSVAIGDFNGDGKQDLAVANNDSANVSILLGNGAGSFGAATYFGVGIDPQSIAVGDFNGDGKQDLAVACAQNMSILLGDGAGSFSQAINFGVGSPSVAIGDFNGDGKQDLALINSVWTGDGAGSFSFATSFVVGTHPESVAVGDFNGDGKQDLAVANRDSGSVSILMGDGTGSFSAQTTFGVGGFPFGVSPHSVAVGDFDGDGKQDLAVANDTSNNVSILLGDGAGRFGFATNFGVGATPFSVAIGDFNGDGKQDLAAASLASGNVSILLRDCAAPQTYALTVGPSAVNSGEAITVTWTAPAGRPANDWIGLYKVGDPDMGFSAWQYTAGAPSGSTTFTAPSQAGQYEFRYFTNNSYTKAATSNAVTVRGSP